VVLVTGARGFVGRAVCKLLQRLSYQVVALDRGPGSEVEIEITDRPKLQQLFEAREITKVIHLAAILPTAARRDPVRATEVNIQGGANVLEMSRQFGVRRFVFGSSLSVYGTCPAGELVSETHGAAPEDLYGAAKLYVEQLGQSYQDLQGLEFVSLRIGRVIGPGARSATSSWRSEIFEFLDTKEAVEISLPYAGSERLLVVHVEDVARMLVALMDGPQLKFCIYNSVCESVVVEELKREIEAINPIIQVRLGDELALGNPRLLDSSRFCGEFGFESGSVFEMLRGEADETSD
jgi:nucleoside-diphosphate-sugar epimerase